MADLSGELGRGVRQRIPEVVMKTDFLLRHIIKREVSCNFGSRRKVRGEVEAGYEVCPELAICARGSGRAGGARHPLTTYDASHIHRFTASGALATVSAPAHVSALGTVCLPGTDANKRLTDRMHIWSSEWGAVAESTAAPLEPARLSAGMTQFGPPDPSV